MLSQIILVVSMVVDLYALVYVCSLPVVFIRYSKHAFVWFHLALLSHDLELRFVKVVVRRRSSLIYL